MKYVSTIVEGHGEVSSLPVLLRRIGAWRTPEKYVEVLTPIRVHRERFINRPKEFQRYLELAASKCSEDGWVLILLDADDDCPAELGKQLIERARHCVPHVSVSVVLANREYEAWFIAAAESLDGHRGFQHDQDHPAPEQPRDAKGWIKARMPSESYRELLDQPAFSAKFDLQQAHNRSRSFVKLCSEWTAQVSKQT